MSVKYIKDDVTLSDALTAMVSLANNSWSFASALSGLKDKYDKVNSAITEEDKLRANTELALKIADISRTFGLMITDIAFVLQASGLAQSSLLGTRILQNSVELSNLALDSQTNLSKIVAISADIPALIAQFVKHPAIIIGFNVFSQIITTIGNIGKLPDGSTLDEDILFSVALERIDASADAIVEWVEDTLNPLKMVVESWKSDGGNSWENLSFIGDKNNITLNDNYDGNENNNIAYGLRGDDYLYGRKGNDLLVGGVGNDHLYGGQGSDIIYGGEDDDHLYAGDMENDLADAGTTNRLYGEKGNDLLYGGAGQDYLYGGEDDDYLHGGNGNDRLAGGKGKDTLDGGDGNDILIAGNSGDRYNKELDMYFLGTKSDFEQLAQFDTDRNILIGGEGNDKIYGSYGNDRIYTGKRVFSPVANDYVNVELSDNGSVNTAYGYTGNDTMFGAAGQDTLYGGAGDDHLYGGDDNDILYGGSGKDYLYGGTGNDIIYTWYSENITGISLDELNTVDHEGNEASGGAGNDLIFGSWGSDILYASEIGNDDLDQNTENSLYGYEGEDYLYGAAGKDRLVGGIGGDELYGGAGDDILIAGDSGDTSGSLGTEADFERLSVLDADQNILIGGGGNDTLYGSHGDDIIYTGSTNTNKTFFGRPDGDDKSLLKSKQVFISKTP